MIQILIIIIEKMEGKEKRGRKKNKENGMGSCTNSVPDWETLDGPLPPAKTCKAKVM